MLKSSRQLLFALLLFAWSPTLFAQSQPSSQQSPPPQQPQAQSQPQEQPKASPDDKTDSVAEAARKAKEKKAAGKAKVFTDDDLSGKKGGVSVVGNEGKRKRTPTANPDGDNEPNGEDYWRSRSQPILDEIAATDERIEQIKDDIKKYGNGGFDVQSGRQQNVAYIEDRNGQIQVLQKHKASLQKQLEDLEEEGRKAGAPPAWFR